MDEFYTAETMMEIWNNELEDEKLYNALIDAYDPFEDVEDEEDFYEGNEDAGMEGYLFGWEA
jgi:hypothetical protein